MKAKRIQGSVAGQHPGSSFATRRDMLRTVAGAVAGLSLGHVLVACSGGSGATGDAAHGADGATGDAPSGDTWATGGTAAMTAKATYPNPFAAMATSCALVTTTTEGPCTTQTDLMRQDISETWAGLPVRLGLRVVDAACNPLVGAVVKIWHTNKDGSYSGQTPNNGMCLKQQAYASQDFFRGAQITDADGIVYFDTCFPGWYRGRAVHIHFQIKVNGVSTRVSQLFFPEPVTTAIFAGHAEYKSYGQPDTVFANDNIMSGISSAARARHMLDVARMSDGAMLASKVVTVV